MSFKKNDKVRISYYIGPFGASRGPLDTIKTVSKGVITLKNTPTLSYDMDGQEICPAIPGCYSTIKKAPKSAPKKKSKS